MGKHSRRKNKQKSLLLNSFISKEREKSKLYAKDFELSIIPTFDYEVGVMISIKYRKPGDYEWEESWTSIDRDMSAKEIEECLLEAMVKSSY